MSTHTELTRLVAGYIRASLQRSPVVRVGPFSVWYDPATANVWRNYAVPDDGAVPDAEDVAALVAWFRARGRTPRLEYVPAAAPAVEGALRRAGFVVEGRPPLMACRPGEVVAPPAVDGVTVTVVAGDGDLYDVAVAQHAAYGEPEPPGPADVARLRATVERGGVVVLARDTGTGEPVGGGLCTAPVDGVSELAAVGVIASHRRRGIATAMTALLTLTAHARGARLVWLEPAGEREAAVYARVGFRPSGHKLWISLPEGPPRG
ncbi:MAG: GNAT family N-acetyltransferase [Micromonosporaceae bacterium]|nr:GNAT family N-acetyltransferase [Natronosporangium sp.]